MTTSPSSAATAPTPPTTPRRPGGNVEDGEDLVAALRRELAEELDLDIDQADGG